ncbi:tat pathway signal sequence protein [Rutstroemia sp. NJR-2017a BVV2]|nr:tat pathway signal sequence protein [Rutstroemia sp. NJR-2017a BVV2]
MAQSVDCNSRCRYTPTIQSPAQEAVFYETVSINTPLDEKSLFTGEPRQELEDAWYDILKYQNIRVTKAELNAINRTSIPLNDAQGGYLANLDVFHELHCLNVIREQVYREYYPDKHSKALQLEHVDHCIDTLRQTMMCHADISLLTYTWIDDYRWPWPRFEIDHECRSWEGVLNWTKSRYIPRLLGPIVAHPVLGVSWRGDEADEY